MPEPHKSGLTLPSFWFLKEVVQGRRQVADGTTRMVKQLKAKGLINTRPHPVKRYGVYVDATEAGKTLVFTHSREVQHNGDRDD